MLINFDNLLFFPPLHESICVLRCERIYMSELGQYWGCNVPAICNSYNVCFGEIIVLGMEKL
jgi:hypothetical protein